MHSLPPPPPPREVLPCISHVVHIGICPTSSTGLVFAPFWSEHRRVASKFRIGNHNLRIETGRFTIPKTPEDLRICDYCNLNSVENKMHILFHCDLYNDLRKTLFLLKSTTEIHYFQFTKSMIKSVLFLTILIHISTG